MYENSQKTTDIADKQLEKYSLVELSALLSSITKSHLTEEMRGLRCLHFNAFSMLSLGSPMLAFIIILTYGFNFQCLFILSLATLLLLGLSGFKVISGLQHLQAGFSYLINGVKLEKWLNLHHDSSYGCQLSIASTHLTFKSFAFCLYITPFCVVSLSAAALSLILTLNFFSWIVAFSIAVYIASVSIISRGIVLNVMALRSILQTLSARVKQESKSR